MQKGVGVLPIVLSREEVETSVNVQWLPLFLDRSQRGRLVHTVKQKKHRGDTHCLEKQMPYCALKRIFTNMFYVVELRNTRIE